MYPTMKRRRSHMFRANELQSIFVSVQTPVCLLSLWCLVLFEPETTFQFRIDKVETMFRVRELRELKTFSR